MAHKFKSALVSVFALTGCTTMGVQEYAQEKPALVLEKFLSGNLQATGFFQDRSGKIVKRFHVDMKGTWSAEQGVLEEDFVYSDGTKSRRVWKIKKTADSKYTGTADDVVGIADGESAGNALRWKYTLDLPVGNKSYHVQFDDWMYLMDDKTLLNKSKMTKFGVELGEVILVIQRK